jgi:hypothetical protein
MTGALSARLFPHPAQQPRPALASNKPYHKFRVLLALDGGSLTRMVMAAAVARCTRLTDRLDILLVNSPKEPTSVLWRLLLTLEHSGIDYRLTSTEGDLGEQVLSYLHRFHGITMVLVNRLTPLEESIGGAMAQLRAQGYRFLSFSEERA